MIGIEQNISLGCARGEYYMRAEYRGPTMEVRVGVP